MLSTFVRLIIHETCGYFRVRLDAKSLRCDNACMTTRRIRLITESFSSASATLDIAVSRAILQGASEGEEPETLRVFKPADMVAFGPQDIRADGYPKAVAATRAGGFEAINRLAGGRAAVFHEETIAFAWTIPDPNPRADVDSRFDEIADIVVTVFRRIGIDAYIGEVSGEYCPGKHSVNARGATKLMGVGQRIISRAAHVGGVVVTGGSQRIRDILVPVYDALALNWQPNTVGSVEDELGSVSYEDVRQSIVDEFASRYDLYEAPLNDETLALAKELAPEHIAPE